jgi:adenine-specific DNA glycosylase
MPDKSRPRVAGDARAFRRRLLRWFRRHGRDLPWRRTRDPYRVAVSEFMLQQTQVSRVEGFYALDRYTVITWPCPPAAVRAGMDGRLPPRAQPARGAGW